MDIEKGITQFARLTIFCPFDDILLSQIVCKVEAWQKYNKVLKFVIKLLQFIDAPLQKWLVIEK